MADFDFAAPKTTALISVYEMFCVQEKETRFDKDPLDTESQSELSDDEPSAKRLKLNSTLDSTFKSSLNSSLNLQVYQIPANYNYNTPKSLSIFPSSPVLPKFVNNPLNLANPLALANEANNIVKNLQTRFSLPAKLTITPVQKTPTVTETGEVIRYKKNGEIAKKRGPPKGYKRKPKDLSKSLSIPTSVLQAQATVLQAQNTILTSLLAANNTSISVPTAPRAECTGPLPALIPLSHPLPVYPPVKLPEGVELIELQLEPADFFPSEPYRMTYSRKKNPKWKLFPYRCEHCFKGYRVPTTLLQHCAERHGSVPSQLAVPCPCCPHVSISRKQHKKHLETHGGRRRRIFCLYCLPTPDPSEPYTREAEKYPFSSHPQYWYASEESLRLHKKRKHPYSALYNYNWFGTWRDTMANS